MQRHWLPNSIHTEDIDLSIRPRKKYSATGDGEFRTHKISVELHPENGYVPPVMLLPHSWYIVQLIDFVIPQIKNSGWVILWRNTEQRFRKNK